MDQLSPARPKTEDAAPPKAAPKADPLPATGTGEAAPTTSRRTRLLMFGLPLALVAGGAGWGG